MITNFPSPYPPLPHFLQVPKKTSKTQDDHTKRYKFPQLQGVPQQRNEVGHFLQEVEETAQLSPFSSFRGASPMATRLHE